MYETLKNAMLAIFEEARKAPDERDEKRFDEAMKTATREIELFKATGSTEGITELEASVAQLRKDVDAQADLVRQYSRAGLVVRGAQVVIPEGRDRRLEMLADGRAFASNETARRFGAFAARALCRQKNMDVPTLVKEIAEDVTKAAGDMDPTVGAAGQYLIPDEFRAEMIRNVEAAARVFPLMRRVPLFTMGQTSWPKRTGGLTAYPTAAGATITRSRVTVDLVTLQPVKWATLNAVPNEFYRSNLLADLGQFIGVEIVYAIHRALDDAVINGDGTADYGGITGILQSATLATVTLAAHTTGATVDQADCDAVVEGLTVEYALDEAQWLMSLSMLLHHKHIRSTTGEPILWDRGDRAAALPPTINDFPFTISNRFPTKVSVTAATKYCAFGDLRMSHLFGMVRNILIDTSPAPYFPEDMTAVRGLVHVDCKEQDEKALVVGKTHA